MAQSGYTPILIYASGTTGNAPVAANLTSSSSGAELALNYFDGKLFYKDASGNVQVLAVKMPSGILPIANGGTNATATPTAGAVAYGTGTAYAFTSAGTPGYLLTSNGSSAPLWISTLPVANGGTNATATPTAGAVAYGTGTAYAFTAAGTSNQVLVSNGASAPTWSNLSSIGVTTFSAGTTGFTPSSATAGAVTLAGTLATTNGGTGLTSFTANGVVYASSSSALTTGSALTFDGSQIKVTSAPPTLVFNSTVNNSARGLLFENSGTQFARMTANFNNGDFRFVSGESGQSGYYFTWFVDGTRSMDLTSTGLGIGTSSPLSKLTVAANNASSGNEQFYITGTANTQQLRIGYNTTSNYGAIQAVQIGTGYRDLVLNADGGNVGIGTSSITSSIKTEIQQSTTGWSNLRLISASSKTSTTTEYPFYITTSEAWASNPFGLEITVKGNATSSSRVVGINAVTVNSTSDGILALNANGGNVAIGYGSSAPQKLTISGGASDVAMLFNSTDTAFHMFGLRKVGSQLRFTEFTNDGSSAFADIMSVEMSGDKVAVGTNSGTTKFTVYEANSTGPSVTIGGANGNGYVAGLRLGYGEGASYTKGAILFENRDATFARGNLNFCLDAAADSGNAVLSDSKFTLSYTGNAILAYNSNPSTWASGDYIGLEIGSNGNSVYGGQNGFNPIAMTSNAYVSSGGTTYTKPYSAASGVFRVQGTIFTWSTSSSTSTGQITDFVTALSLEQDKSLALQGATAQSGTGITFPATQSASSNANTLDDYEEGTWTPAIITTNGNQSITYNTQVGRYIKIGRLVKLSWYINTTAIASQGTGTLKIGGCPGFAADSNEESPGSFWSVAALVGGSLKNYAVGVRVNSGSELLLLDNDTGNLLSTGSMTGGGYAIGQIVYITTA